MLGIISVISRNANVTFLVIPVCLSYVLLITGFLRFTTCGMASCVKGSLHSNVKRGTMRFSPFLL